MCVNLSCFTVASILEPSTAGTIAVIAAIVTILVVDVFFPIDAVAVVGLLLVSLYLTLLIDVSWQWQILIVITIWLATTSLFYVGWRWLASPLTKLLSPVNQESILEAEGDVCVYRNIGGKSFAYWNGELWPAQIDNVSTLKDGDKVLVIKTLNGQFHLKQKKAL
jgi:membrane-bound ClpP family serine protease